MTATATAPTPTVSPANELRIEREIHVEASPEDTFQALLEQAGPCMVSPEGNSLAMKLEAFPGGRWYRDLGDGQGHLWGHVQAIKRPTLLELSGPLFMSTPTTNNVQCRLEASEGGTTLRLVHTAYGPIPDQVREGMPSGWDTLLAGITDALTSR